MAKDTQEKDEKKGVPKWVIPVGILALVIGGVVVANAKPAATTTPKPGSGGSGSAGGSGGSGGGSGGYVASGSTEKDIQTLLNLLGFKGQDGKPLSVDGQLGTNTMFAWNAFMTAKGLSWSKGYDGKAIDSHAKMLENLKNYVSGSGSSSGGSSGSSGSGGSAGSVSLLIATGAGHAGASGSNGTYVGFDFPQGAVLGEFAGETTGGSGQKLYLLKIFGDTNDRYLIEPVNVKVVSKQEAFTALKAGAPLYGSYGDGSWYNPFASASNFQASNPYWAGLSGMGAAELFDYGQIEIIQPVTLYAVPSADSRFKVADLYPQTDAWGNLLSSITGFHVTGIHNNFVEVLTQQGQIRYLYNDPKTYRYL